VEVTCEHLLNTLFSFFFVAPFLQLFGVIVLELSGKRKYYNKKAAFYDLSAQEILRKNPDMSVSISIP